MTAAVLDKATVARVAIAVSEVCKVDVTALLDTYQGAPAFSDREFSRVLLCCALGDLRGVSPAAVGLGLGFWLGLETGRVRVLRNLGSDRSRKSLARVHEISKPGGITADMRRRQRAALEPRRSRPAKKAIPKTGDRDQALIDEFIARKGVTKCAPGQALGLSAREVEFGVLGVAPKPLMNRAAAGKG